MKYFAKELPQQSFWYKDGTKCNCTVTAQSLGLIAIDETADPNHAQELEEAAAKRIAGILSLTQEEYEVKKKAIVSLAPPSGQPATATGRPTVRLVDPMSFQSELGKPQQSSSAAGAREPARPTSAAIVEVHPAPTATAPGGSAADGGAEVAPTVKALKPTTARVKKRGP